MKMRIIFLFAANPAGRMPKSGCLSKLSYERSAKYLNINLDPSQTTSEKQQICAFSMLDLAKRMGLE